jgi:hypothetical protein
VTVTVVVTMVMVMVVFSGVIYYYFAFVPKIQDTKKSQKNHFLGDNK